MTKQEKVFISVVTGIVFIASFFNLEQAKLKARDVQRKNDLKHVATALNKYFYDFGIYPEERDGKILICGSAENLRVCEWGQDSIKDLRDPDYPPYINPLPRDPKQERAYIYRSNTRNYQLFASLENSGDPEYNKKVESRGIQCGDIVCNFGISSLGTPDKELEALPTPTPRPSLPNEKNKER